MRRGLVTLAGLSLVAGCGGTQLEPLPDIQPMCDGSDDIRLVYGTGGGFVAFEDEFTAKYGRRYLAIDGHCNYWRGWNTVHGLSAGTIEPERATTLANELHFGRYSSAPGARGEPCEDSGVAYLRDVTGTLIDISCDSVSDATFVWVAAFERVRRLWTELEAEARPSWVNTSLLVLRDPSPSESRAAEWTAALDLETLAIDYTPTAAGPGPGFALAAPTLEFVNGLRQSVLDRGANPFVLFVRTPAERYYQLYVRDEPPAPVAAALEQTLATEW
ncbi:MAG TPA: hypothetical protein VMG12_07635 [Polyangiaceae bacterium]|nr:hypothetical protein [Polyangiaceae bacterium]